jgi:[acyl-carrier-protein] S-malonyltransferase
MTDTPASPVFLLFPGQGAQHVGMGQSWFEKCPAAAKTFAAADEALGMDLTGLCFNGPEANLNRTDIAQVAIFVTSVACYEALNEAPSSLGAVEAAAGLSLGEFTALHIAGAFDFQDGLKLVQLRGQAMQEAAEATNSSMVAITGDIEEEKINELCDRARGDGVLVPANFNSPMQVVISGSADACERAVAVADDMGFKATPLTVAGAFHSPLMQLAADRLAAALDQVQWNQPRLPVLCNVTAQPHEAGDIDSIKQRLVEQLTNPVRWCQSMQWAVANYADVQFVELAPGKVLAGLMRRIDRKTKVQNHAQPAPVPA